MQRRIFRDVTNMYDKMAKLGTFVIKGYCESLFRNNNIVVLFIITTNDNFSTVCLILNDKHRMFHYVRLS